MHAHAHAHAESLPAPPPPLPGGFEPGRSIIRSRLVGDGNLPDESPPRAARPASSLPIDGLRRGGSWRHDEPLPPLGLGEREGRSLERWNGPTTPVGAVQCMRACTAAAVACNL